MQYFLYDSLLSLGNHGEPSPMCPINIFHRVFLAIVHFPQAQPWRIPFCLKSRVNIMVMMSPLYCFWTMTAWRGSQSRLVRCQLCVHYGDNVDAREVVAGGHEHLSQLVKCLIGQICCKAYNFKGVPERKSTATTAEQLISLSHSSAFLLVSGYL